MLIHDASAAQLSLSWDANDPVPEGYKLFSRLDNGQYDYTNPIWQGAEISTPAIAGPEIGHTMHFVVRAFDGADESEDSNEVAYNEPDPNAPWEEIIDNDDPMTSQTGEWIGSGCSDYYGEGSVFSNGTANDTFKYTFATPAKGVYELYEWHTCDGTDNRAPATLQVNDGTTISDQVIDDTENCGQWNSVGQYTMAAAGDFTATIEALDVPAGKNVSADAMKLVMVEDQSSISPPDNAGVSATQTMHITFEAVNPDGTTATHSFDQPFVIKQTPEGPKMGMDLKMNMLMGYESTGPIGSLVDIGISNAVSDPYGTEADSTDGFTAKNLEVFESQAAEVDTGSYAFHAETILSIGRFYKELSPYTSTGHTYRLVFRAKHIGTGGTWSVGYTGWNGTAGGTLPTNGGVDITSADTTWKEYQVDITSTISGNNYIIAAENNATNDGGIYLDNLALYDITGL